LTVTSTFNMSYAEQQPSLYTLGDGFIGIGDYYGLSSNYALDITGSFPTSTVPVPSTLLLMGSAFARVLMYGRRRWRR
jgi:hypothetical protein